MRKTFIYGLADPASDVIRYIGKADNPEYRLIKHLKTLNANTHKINWLKSLKKLGLQPKLVVLDEVAKAEWEFWEQYWISQFRTWGFELTNGTSGGGGSNGFKHTEESKLKMSQRQLGKPMAESTKKKLSLLNTGKPGAFKNKTHSAEAREKIRLAKLGKSWGKHTPEFKAKVAENNKKKKGFVHTAETRLKMSNSHKSRGKLVLP
jgi:group I intron endonuclease